MGLGFSTPTKNVGTWYDGKPLSDYSAGILRKCIASGVFVRRRASANPTDAGMKVFSFTFDGVEYYAAPTTVDAKWLSSPATVNNFGAIAMANSLSFDEVQAIARAVIPASKCLSKADFDAFTKSCGSAATAIHKLYLSAGSDLASVGSGQGRRLSIAQLSPGGVVGSNESYLAAAGTIEGSCECMIGGADDSISVVASAAYDANKSFKRKLAESVAAAASQLFGSVKAQGTVEEKLAEFSNKLSSFKPNDSARGELCKKLAGAINGAYGSTVVSPDISPDVICGQIAEILMVLSTGMTAEFLGVVNDVHISLGNLKLLSDIMKQNFAAASGKFAKSSERVYFVKLGELNKLVSEEIARQTAMLAGLINTNLTETEKMIATYVRDFDSVRKIVDLSTDDRFGQNLLNILKGLGITASMANLIDKSLKKIGLTMSDYAKAANRESWEDLVAAKIIDAKLDEKTSNDLLDAYELLKKNFPARKQIGEVAAAQVVGSAEIVMSEADRAKRRETIRNMVVLAFNTKITTDYRAYIAAVGVLSNKFGSEIPLSDDLKLAVDALAEFETQIRKILRKDNIGKALLGLGTATQSRTEKDTINANIDRVSMVLNALTAKPEYAASKHYFDDVITAVTSLKSTIEKYTDQMESRSGLGRVGAGEYTGGLDNILEGKYITKEEMEIAPSKKFEFAYKIAQLKDSLKHASKLYDVFQKDYEPRLTEAIKRKVNKVNEDHKIRAVLIASIANSDFKAAASKTNDEIRAVRENFWYTSETLDHYLKNFTQLMTEDVDAVKDIGNSIASVDVISEWYTESLGNNLFDLYNNFGYENTPQHRASGLNSAGDTDHPYSKFDDNSVKHAGNPYLPLPATNAAALYADTQRVLSKFSLLKNLLSVFGKFGSKFGETNLSEKSFMTTGLIYKNLLKMLVYSSYTFGSVHGHTHPRITVDVATGKETRAAHDGALANASISYPIGNVNSTTDPSVQWTAGAAVPASITGNAADNVENVRIFGVAMANVVQVGLDDASYLFRDEIKHFALLIKAIAAKILTVAGVSGLINHAYDYSESKKIPASRFILGGDEPIPVIEEGAAELYVRLPLLMQFYKTFFIAEKSTTSPEVFDQAVPYKISMIPDSDGVFSSLIKIMLLQQSPQSQLETYNDSTLMAIIGEINIIYNKMRVKYPQDTTRNTIDELIAEVNRRYGIIKQVDIDKFNESVAYNRFTPADTNNQAKITREIAILDGEDGVTSAVSTPAMKAGSHARSFNFNVDPDRFKYSDIRYAYYELINKFRERLEKELNGSAPSTIKPAIKQLVKRLKIEKDPLKRYNYVSLVVRGRGGTSGNDLTQQFMFAETVGVAINQLQNMYAMLQNFRIYIHTIGSGTDVALAYVHNSLDRHVAASHANLTALTVAIAAGGAANDTIYAAQLTRRFADNKTYTPLAGGAGAEALGAALTRLSNAAPKADLAGMIDVAIDAVANKLGRLKMPSDSQTREKIRQILTRLSGESFNRAIVFESDDASETAAGANPLRLIRIPSQQNPTANSRCDAGTLYNPGNQTLFNIVVNDNAGTASTTMDLLRAHFRDTVVELIERYAFEPQAAAELFLDTLYTIGDTHNNLISVNFISDTVNIDFSKMRELIYDTISHVERMLLSFSDASSLKNAIDDARSDKVGGLGWLKTRFSEMFDPKPMVTDSRNPNSVHYYASLEDTVQECKTIYHNLFIREYTANFDADWANPATSFKCRGERNSFARMAARMLSHDTKCTNMLYNTNKEALDNSPSDVDLLGDGIEKYLMPGAPDRIDRQIVDTRFVRRFKQYWASNREVLTDGGSALHRFNQLLAKYLQTFCEPNNKIYSTCLRGLYNSQFNQAFVDPKYTYPDVLPMVVVNKRSIIPIENDMANSIDYDLESKIGNADYNESKAVFEHILDLSQTYGPALQFALENLGGGVDLATNTIRGNVTAGAPYVAALNTSVRTKAYSAADYAAADNSLNVYKFAVINTILTDPYISVGGVAPAATTIAHFRIAGAALGANVAVNGVNIANPYDGQNEYSIMPANFGGGGVALSALPASPANLDANGLIILVNDLLNAIIRNIAAAPDPATIAAIANFSTTLFGNVALAGGMVPAAAGLPDVSNRVDTLLLANKILIETDIGGGAAVAVAALTDYATNKAAVGAGGLAAHLGVATGAITADGGLAALVKTDRYANLNAIIDSLDVIRRHIDAAAPYIHTIAAIGRTGLAYAGLPRGAVPIIPRTFLYNAAPLVPVAGAVATIPPPRNITFTATALLTDLIKLDFRSPKGSVDRYNNGGIFSTNFYNISPLPGNGGFSVNNLIPKHTLKQFMPYFIIAALQFKEFLQAVIKNPDVTTLDRDRVCFECDAYGANTGNPMTPHQAIVPAVFRAYEAFAASYGGGGADPVDLSAAGASPTSYSPIIRAIVELLSASEPFLTTAAAFAYSTSATANVVMREDSVYNMYPEFSEVKFGLAKLASISDDEFIRMLMILALSGSRVGQFGANIDPNASLTVLAKFTSAILGSSNNVLNNFVTSKIASLGGTINTTNVAAGANNYTTTPHNGLLGHILTVQNGLVVANRAAAASFLVSGGGGPAPAPAVTAILNSLLKYGKFLSAVKTKIPTHCLINSIDARYVANKLVGVFDDYINLYKVVNRPKFVNSATIPDTNDYVRTLIVLSLAVSAINADNYVELSKIDEIVKRLSERVEQATPYADNNSLYKVPLSVLQASDVPGVLSVGSNAKLAEPTTGGLTHIDKLGYTSPVGYDYATNKEVSSLRNDATSDTIIFTSLAQIIGNIVNARTSAGPAFLAENVADLLQSTKEKMRANMPVFKNLFIDLGRRVEFILRAVIERSPMKKRSIVTYSTTNGILQDVYTSPWPFTLVPVTTDDKENKARYEGVAKALIDLCAIMAQSCDAVLREIADDPKYGEVYQDSSKDYQIHNTNPPLAPLSVITAVQHNRGDDVIVQDNYMPVYNMGHPVFKYMYATRALLSNLSSPFTLEKIANYKQILSDYNSLVELADSLDETTYTANAKNIITMARYLYGIRLKGSNSNVIYSAHPAVDTYTSIRASASAPYKYAAPNSGTLARINLYAMKPYWQHINKASADNEYTNNGGPGTATTAYGNGSADLPYVLRVSADYRTAVSCFEALSRTEKMREMVLGGKNQQEATREISNIIDMGIMPINVHAIMREIPLANVYNYAHSFIGQAREYFVGDRKADTHRSPTLDDKSPAWEYVVKFLANPYSHNFRYADFRIGHAAGATVLGTPKFIADQLMNKVLYDSYYNNVDKVRGLTSAKTTTIADISAAIVNFITQTYDKISGAGKPAMPMYPDTRDVTIKTVTELVTTLVDNKMDMTKYSAFVASNPAGTTAAKTLSRAIMVLGAYHARVLAMKTSPAIASQFVDSLISLFASSGATNVVGMLGIGANLPAAMDAILARMHLLTSGDVASSYANRNIAKHDTYGVGATTRIPPGVRDNLDADALTEILAFLDNINAFATAYRGANAMLGNAVATVAAITWVNMSDVLFQDLVGNGVRNGTSAASYWYVSDSSVSNEYGNQNNWSHMDGAMNSITVAHDPNSDVLPDMRFDSVLVRSLALITDSFRIVRAKIEEDVNYSRDLVDKAGKLIGPSLTEMFSGYKHSQMKLVKHRDDI